MDNFAESSVKMQSLTATSCQTFSYGCENRGFAIEFVMVVRSEVSDLIYQASPPSTEQ